MTNAFTRPAIRTRPRHRATPTGPDRRAIVKASAAMALTGGFSGSLLARTALADDATPTALSDATAALGTDAAAALPTDTAALTSDAAAAGGAKWPGHQPGKIYLGASCSGSLQETISKVGKVGLYRSYYTWDNFNGETNTIRGDRSAGRMSWISFKPPGVSKPWAAIASGRYDSTIRSRARAYAGLGGPAIVTFNHEPQNDNHGSPADWVRAWCRIHDVMKSETGLKNIIHVPIIGEYVWNPVNKRDDPAQYATPEVLNRCHFLGVDLYQNASGKGYAERLGVVLDYLNKKGHSDKMVGIGETGCSEDFRKPSAAEWWNASWKWAASNTNRIGAISYFNSNRNLNNGHKWVLWESSAKLNAYRASISSSVSTGV